MTLETRHLDPQVHLLVDQMASANVPSFRETPPAVARERLSAAREQLGAGPDVASVYDVVIDGGAEPVHARVYRPAAESNAVAVYFHGGGWVVGNVEMSDGFCRVLANHSGWTVVSVDYRLAPECPFPAALDDAWTSVQWAASRLTELGSSPASLVLIGDSAGGNLAAVYARRARDLGIQVAAQVLLYPITDADFDRPSYRENASGYLLTTDDMRWFWDQYVSDAAARQDPDAAPLRASDLEGLAPALIITAEFDPLRDEGEEYAERLVQAGVPVALRRYGDMVHGFFTQVQLIDRSLIAIDDAITSVNGFVDTYDAPAQTTLENSAEVS